MISNKALAVLVVAAIVVSVFSTLLTLDSLTKFRQLADEQVTGRLTTGDGQVNFSVSNTASILMNNAIIDFGSGYVNATKCTNATLTVNDTGFSDPGDCWVATPNSADTPILFENDGNVNATLTVTGENGVTFFNSYSGSYPYNITWTARNNETLACTEWSGTASSAWNNFTGGADSICDNFRFLPENQDELAVDIRITVPVDLPPGQYQDSDVTFTVAPVS